MIRMYNFRQKEVININDGKRLGYITDLLLDETDGKLSAIIILREGKKLGFFGKESEYVIGWDKIKKMGDDIILVDVDFED